MIAGLIVETELLTREQIISFVNVVFENEPTIILMYPLHMASTSQFQANYLSVGIGQMRGYVENENGLIRGSDYLICILSDHKFVHKLREKTEKALVCIWPSGAVTKDEKGKERKA